MKRNSGEKGAAEASVCKWLPQKGAQKGRLRLERGAEREPAGWEVV